MAARNCIALGDGANAQLDNEFCLAANGKHYKTILTQEEFEVISTVIRRCKEHPFIMYDHKKKIQ